MRGSSALEPVGGSRDGDSRRRGKQLVDAEGRPAAASQLERFEALVVLRERAGIPQPAIERSQQLAVHRVVADHTAVPPRLRRAMSVRPCTARSRTTGIARRPARHRRSPTGRLPTPGRCPSTVRSPGQAGARRLSPRPARSATGCAVCLARSSGLATTEGMWRPGAAPSRPAYRCPASSSGGSSRPCRTRDSLSGVWPCRTS